MNPIENAARSLSRAGRWFDAMTLLDAFPHDSNLNLMRAEVAVDHDFWTGGNAADQRLAALSDGSWDASFLRLRVAYTAQMRRLLAGGEPDTDALAEQIGAMVALAPTEEARAYAHLYLGLVHDVLGDDRTRAEPHYRTALDTTDDYISGYALRHLGALADDIGDHEAAVTLWKESLAKRQASGHLTGSLAQLLLLRDDVSLIETVGDWAEQLHLRVLAAQAKESLS
jgi:tetratricopeptide (TPR) repeat protein